MKTADIFIIGLCIFQSLCLLTFMVVATWHQRHVQKDRDEIARLDKQIDYKIAQFKQHYDQRHN